MKGGGDLRNAWNSHLPPDRGPGRPSPGDVKVTGVPKGGGFRFSSFLGLVILAGLGYGAWKYGPAIVAKFHIATDAENAADEFVRGIQPSSPSEASLQETCVLGIQGPLSRHQAKKTRWYVAYGPVGGSEKPRVVKDDGFQPDARAFFDGLVGETALATTGRKHAPKPSTLMADWKNAEIREDSRTWRVVVGWSENVE